ncbi:MAG: SURF1 family protein [Alphaproteobacteria bacterium]
MKRRFPFAATFCTAAAIAAMCSLGFWQLERLQWKTGLLKNIDAEYEKDARAIKIAPDDLEENFDLRRGTLTGRYDFDRQVTWIPRLYEKNHGQDVPGKDIMTPLLLSDGSTILVNRGWAPAAWDQSAEDNRPEGQVSITGTVRPLSKRSPFAATNRPDRGQWYYPDPGEYAAFYKIQDMQRHVLFREDEDLGGAYPLPSHERPLLPNNHQQYALFWFGMAAILAIMYVIRFFVKVGSADD